MPPPLPGPSREKILRTSCAHCAPEPASGPLTPSLSPSAGGGGARRPDAGKFLGSPFRFFACIATMNPPLTPPRRGTGRPRTNAGSLLRGVGGGLAHGQVGGNATLTISSSHIR